MFWKITTFGHFGRIRSPSSDEFDRNCEKVNLLTNNFHLGLKPSHYDLPFKRSSPYKLMYQKAANIRWPDWVETVKGTYTHQYLSFEPITKSLFFPDLY